MDELDCFCFWWERPKWFMTFLYYRCIYLLQLWGCYYSLIIQNVHFCVMIWGRSISGGIFFVPVIWKRAFVIYICYLYFVLRIYLKCGLNDVWTSDYTADLFRLLKLTLIQLLYFWTQTLSQSESTCLTAAQHRHHASSGTTAVQRFGSRRCKK